MLFSATQYNIEIEAYQPLPPNTHLFDMIFYINNNTLEDQFPGNTVFFNVHNGLVFGFEGEGPSSDSSFSDPAVFNTIELSIVTSSTFNFNILYSTTIVAQVVPALGILATSVNVSVNVTKPVYECTGNECFNGGTCILAGAVNEIFSCICDEGFQGEACEIDPCQINPCTNGNCSIFNNYICECYLGYTGQDCSINIDDCSGINCGNGTCIDLVNGYKCHCSPGFTGNNCQTDINECDPNPCINAVNCNDLTNDYQCDCYLDWEGKNCSSEINLCEYPFSPVFPCDLIGYDKCIDGNDTYTCECRSGYTGNNCSIDINECDPQPCINGACTDLINSYQCDCYLDWEGENCNHEIDMCVNPNDSQFPCSLVGYDNCTVGNNTYTCDCKDGFTGNNCEINIDDCDPNPCINGACTDHINSYQCDCYLDWEGVNCDSEIDLCSNPYVPCSPVGYDNCIDGNNTYLRLQRWFHWKKL